MTIDFVRKRFSVVDYEQMVSAGALGEDERGELLDGEIVEKSPIGSRHAACVKRLTRLLVQKLGDRAIIGVQDPVRLDRYSEPESDLAVLVPRDDYYASGHPTPADVLLLIEVADTSLEQDRTLKLPLYARAGVPAVWLVDLAAGVVDSYRQPSPDGYLLRQRHRRGQSLVIDVAGIELSLAVDDVIPAGA